MECSSSCSTVLDSWSRSTYPQQCHQLSLQCIFLFNINTYAPSAIWQNIIWLLHDHTKCHIWSKLALEDEGYESGSENLNIPTPLQRTFRIHHISSIKNASFNPVPVTPCSTWDSQLIPVCRRLTYRSSDDDNTIEKRSLPLTVHHKCRTIHMIHDHCLPSTPKTFIFTWKKKRISKPFHQMMNIGLLNKFLTDHYVYTFIATQTIPIPISIFGLPSFLLLWLHGFKWHLWIQRPDDHFQWWRHSCTRWHWILKRLWLEMNIYIFIFYLTRYFKFHTCI